MAKKMLIDATHPEETRVVVVRGNRVEEFDFETAQRKQLRGNIYLAKVTRVEPSLQAAFIAHDAFQCGFCTPGQIMSALGLIQEGQAGDDPERVREGMSGNLCRCGAYRGITEAVLETQRTMSRAERKEAA